MCSSSLSPLFTPIVVPRHLKITNTAIDHRSDVCCAPRDFFAFGAPLPAQVLLSGTQQFAIALSVVLATCLVVFAATR